MANKFLAASDLLAQGDDTLGYIRYETFSEEHKEFIRNDFWHLEFLTTPRAVYFPGNPMINARLTGCTPAFQGDITQLSAIIRQFYIHQAVRSGQSNGSISLQFVDREDQAIRAFIWDWQEKIGGIKDRYAFRKEDTVCTIKLSLMNSSRKAIAKWTMYGCQLAQGGTDIHNKPYASDDPTNIGEMDVTINFEHYDPEFLNL